MIVNYVTGETIKLGDKVGLGEDRGGVVVALIGTREFISVVEYGESYKEPPWEFLKKRRNDSLSEVRFDLLRNCGEDDDLEFISRGSFSVDKKK